MCRWYGKRHCHEKCQGCAGISQGPIFTIHSNVQQLGLSDGDKTDSKVLKIKKNDVEYKFDKKISENANGGYLMGMEIDPDKIAEEEKEKATKTTKKLKILKNEK